VLQFGKQRDTLCDDNIWIDRKFWQLLYQTLKTFLSFLFCLTVHCIYGLKYEKITKNFVRYVTLRAGARSVQTLMSSLSDQSQLSPDHVVTRPRRASMYDALDFTKIDASLYQRPVCETRNTQCSGRHLELL